jgi:hypothetical protein
MYVKASVIKHISNIDTLIIKTGMMGALGNKGSVLIKFDLYDSSFAFACSHLAAGSSANTSRVQELSDILQRSFGLNKDLVFHNHDYTFILGDLNFRIDLPFYDCLELINNKELIKLCEFDQLNKSKIVNLSLSNIKEGKLTFNPTYKFIAGTGDYDAKKKRVPSWCDRILYKKNNSIEQLEYKSVDLLFSDHKPVYSIFKITLNNEIKEEKSKIYNEIKKNVVLGINPSLARTFSGMVDLEKEVETLYIDNKSDLVKKVSSRCELYPDKESEEDIFDVLK